MISRCLLTCHLPHANDQIFLYKFLSMKKFILLATLLNYYLISIAQMDIPPVGFNPRATISEEVGITSISIKYSRPGVKGREGKIWGGLVPYGFATFSFLTGRMTSPW